MLKVGVKRERERERIKEKGTLLYDSISTPPVLCLNRSACKEHPSFLVTQNLNNLVVTMLVAPVQIYTLHSPYTAMSIADRSHRGLKKAHRGLNKVNHRSNC